MTIETWTPESSQKRQHNFTDYGLADYAVHRAEYAIRAIELLVKEVVMLKKRVNELEGAKENDH